MAKEYTFKYAGTKASFLALLEPFHTNNSRFYYLDDYMIEVLEEEIRLGIGRAGHSGGHWFISKFAEENNQIEFHGTIQYIGPEDERTKAQKAFGKIGEVLLSILLFPVFACLSLIDKIQWLIRKIRKQPHPKTTEDKLLNLMENRLHCQRVIE